MAEGAGFEPAMELPPYTLSRRAPSTARPPLRTHPVARGGRRRLAKHPAACNAASERGLGEAVVARRLPGARGQGGL